VRERRGEGRGAVGADGVFAAGQAGGRGARESDACRSPSLSSPSTLTLALTPATPSRALRQTISLHRLLNVGRYTAWWKWHPQRHRGALHTNEVSSTASQAAENDQTNVGTERSFQAFST
jgi:hypothetical protein